MKNVYYKDIIKSDFNITEYLKELISEIIDEKFGKIKETQEIEKEKDSNIEINNIKPQYRFFSYKCIRIKNKRNKYHNYQ